MTDFTAPAEPIPLTNHDVMVLSLVLQHELERLRTDHVTGHAFRRRDLIADAAWTTLVILRKVSPTAAETWTRHNGTPSTW